MAAAYRVNTEKPAQATIADIRHAVSIWNRDAGETAVSAFDVPPSPKVGGVEAVVRIELRGRPVEFRCGSQRTYSENLRCCFLALDSMRLNERRGIGEVMQTAYAMLSAPKAERDPYEVLGVRSNLDLEDIEAVWRSKVKRAHPDAGGTAEAAAELNGAIERIRKERAR